MDIQLDKSSMNILKNIFDWTDVDGDGTISRADLKASSGLQNDEEVEAVFQALIASVNGDPNSDGIQYEDFSKGILDFPFLIDQFKNDYNRESVFQQITEEDVSSNPAVIDEDLEFLSRKLQETIVHYNKALKIEDPQISSLNKEDLLDSMRISLEKLRNKCKGEGGNYNDIINGSIEMYLLVRDLSRYHEEVISDYRALLYEKQQTIDDLEERNERFEHRIDNLQDIIARLETSEKKTTTPI